MLRSIFAVVVGFLVWTLLWLGGNLLLTTISPNSFREDGSTENIGILLLLLVLSFVYSILAGYITARITTKHGRRDALILGIVLLVVGIAVQIQYWDLLPIWYHLGFLALLIPGSLLGSRLKVH